jgi:thermitase
VKPHIELKLREGAALPDAPHWERIIDDKTQVAGRLPSSVASVLARWALPVWITREHAPASDTWSPEEVASGLDRIYRLVLREARRVEPALLSDITLVPEVEYARLGQIGVVSIPERAEALTTRTGRAARDAIGLDDAHRHSRGEPAITVAVLDTGVDVNHRELRGRTLPGRDFVDILDGFDDFVGDILDADDDPADEVGHGTHVAGIILGSGARMPTGVVPRCRLLPVRVLGAMRQGDRLVGAGLIDNINSGIKWAVDQGADVINMSLGVRHSGGGLPHQEVVEYALRKGVTIVAAAGNDGAERLYYPGALPGVIAVGAVDDGGSVAPYSTYGAQVSFVAPGTDVYSSVPGNAYAFSTGTSHACPFVSGAAAMLKSFARAERGRKLADRQVKHILKHTADRVDGQFKHRKAGFGMLNVADAMRLLRHKLN